MFDIEEIWENATNAEKLGSSMSFDERVDLTAMNTLPPICEARSHL